MTRGAPAPDDAFRRRERDILEAARALLGEASWELVTVSAIADRAGIGKGTVYKHFDGKDQIVARIQIDHERDLFWELKQGLDDGLGPVARYRRLVHLLWAHNRVDWAYHRRMVQYAHRPSLFEGWGEGLVRDYLAVNDAIHGLYRDAIADGIAAGVFRDLGVDRMLTHGANAVGGALRQALTHHDAAKDLVDEDLDLLLDFILRGFGCPEDRLRAQA